MIGPETDNPYRFTPWFSEEQLALDPILVFFAWEHLPAHLAYVSRQFYELAHNIVDDIERTPERTVALRKLLESKDAAVRAAL